MSLRHRDSVTKIQFSWLCKLSSDSLKGAQTLTRCQNTLDTWEWVLNEGCAQCC